MQYRKLSQRQRLAMLWWRDPRFSGHTALICDGSIRSGKTLSMAVGFVLWSMTTFNSQSFALCGKTIESFRRNVSTPLAGWLEGLCTIREHRQENKLTITIGQRKNTYYLFGGRDESSYALIQGMTLAGVLMDEVALMPRSFVEQAMARCSVEGSRFWMNCNPQGPQHWFYKEWIQQAATPQKNALHLHFTMVDNLSLSDAIRQRYEGMYSGVFYDRYIRGLWCVAEGLIYTMFDPARHVVQAAPEGGRYYISVDYGTLNPFSAGLWCLGRDGVAVRLKEYYYDGRKTQRQQTDAEYYLALEALAGELPIEAVVVDPSAASFITTIRRGGRFRVRQAQNSVLDGIRRTAALLQADRLFFHRSCRDSIREFSLYRWDEKAAEDRPLKQDDHAMDDIRYFVNTILAKRGDGITILK